MALIFHLTYKDAWEYARPTGEYAAPSLAEEGFIHCSKDIPQLLKVAARLYPGETNLLVLDVDLVKLTAPLKSEPSRSGEIYPPIYGTARDSALPINTNHKQKIERPRWLLNGTFLAVTRKGLIHDEVPKHEKVMPREGANELVGAGRRGGESHFSRSSWNNQCRIGNNLVIIRFDPFVSCPAGKAVTCNIVFCAVLDDDKVMAIGGRGIAEIHGNFIPGFDG